MYGEDYYSAIEKKRLQTCSGYISYGNKVRGTKRGKTPGNVDSNREKNRRNLNNILLSMSGAKNTKRVGQSSKPKPKPKQNKRKNTPQDRTQKRRDDLSQTTTNKGKSFGNGNDKNENEEESRESDGSDDEDEPFEAASKKRGSRHWIDNVGVKLKRRGQLHKMKPCS